MNKSDIEKVAIAWWYTLKSEQQLGLIEAHCPFSTIESIINDELVEMYSHEHKPSGEYIQMRTVFEELLVQHIVTKELRDWYRQKAGYSLEDLQK